MHFAHCDLQVLETFSHQERGAFLRFVWGRSRLPRPSDFTEAFKIHVLPAGDDRLPAYLPCVLDVSASLHRYDCTSCVGHSMVSEAVHDKNVATKVQSGIRGSRVKVLVSGKYMTI